jgi:hypothetical protein
MSNVWRPSLEQVFNELWMYVHREIEEASMICNNDLRFQYEDKVKQMNDKSDLKRCITNLGNKHTRKHQDGQVTYFRTRIYKDVKEMKAKTGNMEQSSKEIFVFSEVAGQEQGKRLIDKLQGGSRNYNKKQGQRELLEGVHRDKKLEENNSISESRKDEEEGVSQEKVENGHLEVHYNNRDCKNIKECSNAKE